MKMEFGDEKSKNLSAVVRPGRLGGSGGGEGERVDEEVGDEEEEQQKEGRMGRRPSDNLLDAGPLEAASAALLLDLTGGPVASAPPAGQGGARRQLDVLLVNTCEEVGGG